MMKYALGIVALLLIGGGIWWYLQPNGNKSITVAAVALAAGEKPWIEVITASATAEDTKGATTTLQTGDEVAIGSVIKTGAVGVVLVHFPDGSFAKLDPNSSITITEAKYDESSGSTNVHITLGTGTLWSKVLDLVGVSSSWKVETSNAVATVRGTSFMTSITKGKTKVVGIENKVTVTPLQLDTHQPLGVEADVTVDTQVTIDDTHLAALASGKEKLATTTMSADIPKSGAYKAFKEREQQFNTLHDSLQTQLGNDAEFRKEFRDAQVKDFKDKILERREKNGPPPPPLPPPDQTNAPVGIKPEMPPPPKPPRPPSTTAEIPVEKTTTPNPTTAPINQNIVPTTQSGGGGTPDVHPVSLSVTSESDLTLGVTDGDTAVFHAILLLSDNSKKDVTDLVAWNVINNIGVFPTPGSFHAQLSPNDAELGEVPGAVYATLTGPDGKELNAASKQFSVHAFVPPQTATGG
ncbi:MAG: FecR domain-containing protein [bacterium]|nr:FecR domain-containing protein [bacterium]